MTATTSPRILSLESADSVASGGWGCPDCGFRTPFTHRPGATFLPGHWLGCSQLGCSVTIGPDREAPAPAFTYETTEALVDGWLEGQAAELGSSGALYSSFLSFARGAGCSYPLPGARWLTTFLVRERGFSWVRRAGQRVYSSRPAAGAADGPGGGDGPR